MTDKRYTPAEIRNMTDDELNREVMRLRGYRVVGDRVIVTVGNNSADAYLPNVCGGVDEALDNLTLPPEHEWTLGLTPTYDGGISMAVITNEDRQQVGISYRRAGELARAMVEAWVTMKSGKEG